MKISWFILSALLVSSVFYGGLLISGKVYATADSLVGYWSLNEGAGNVAYDASGNGNDGNLTGAPSWTNGMSGTAVHFDGVHNYIEVPNSNTLNNANFTIEAWIYLDEDVQGTQARVVSKQQADATSYSLEIFGMGYGGSNGNRLVFEIGTGSTYVELKSNSYLSNRTWYYVAGTQNDTMSNMYINGTLDTSGTTATQTTSNPAVLTIGCLKANGFAPTFFFKGIIDEIRIYNKALNQSEIEADMNKIVPEFPSFLIMPLFLMATLFVAVIVYRRKHFYSSGK
jgi:hypothetical protein